MQMADIARLAGVSTSTVSRALSGSPLISEETRERIQTLAQQFRYTVNRAATDLRLGINSTIAVVIPYEPERRQSFADPFFHGMMGSLADALTERGYEMLLVRLDAEHLDDAAALIDTGRAAGVILIGQWRHHDQLNLMAERGLPMVVWGGRMKDQHYCTIGSDNVAGGRMAAQHLLAQGARRILFIGDRGLPEVAQRHRGFLAGLRAAGRDRKDVLYLDVPFLADVTREAVLGLLDRRERFDALFACSDLLAMAAIGALRERDLAVPQDVAVVGYDDVGLAAHFNPPLSTVRQPIQAGGAALVDALLEYLHEGRMPSSKLLETELIERGSSRRIPA